MDLKSQIRDVLQRYSGDDPKIAMLSGMGLVSSYLAKHDGSKTVTASAVLQAVYAVGKELGLEVGKL